jgi:hypothetical protein
MSLRFWRRFKILPGVTLNLSKSGPSISVGPRGAKITVGPRGLRGTVGMPGTGLYYTKSMSLQAERASARSRSKQPAPPIAERPRRAAPPIPEIPDLAKDLAVLDLAMDHIQAGDEQAAIARARAVGHLSDGAFLAGVLSLRTARPASEAVILLERAVAGADTLGLALGRLERELAMSLTITDELTAIVRPDPTGAVLALSQALLLSGDGAGAEALLARALAQDPEEGVLQAALAAIGE